MNPPKALTVLFVLASVLLSTAGLPRAAVDPFPMPDVIAPNVAFWTNVYARYTTGQGIVHDNRDLERIYAVIDLIPYDVPTAEDINRKRMKGAVHKVESILHRLSRNPDVPDDVCRRVADLFDPPRDAKQFARAAARVRCQIGQKDRFRAGLIRSGAYIGRIRTIFASLGLPADLAYLPHVESSFNPNAYSKFGAAGMWQFTRTTGQRFMEVAYVLDERRDPILSTQAAAELLKENFEKLGSWPLAITAYNHGAAGMQRAQRLYGDFAHIFRHYRSRTFKFASRNFYAEFLAARQIAASYQAYFGELALQPPAATRTVVLEGFASFDDLSEHFGIDPHSLKRMNLALRQPVFSGRKYVPKGYMLHLPAGPEAGRPETADLPDEFYHAKQKPSRFYTVQRGDTAGRIARMHGVDLHDLILANNLDRRATIYPRQNLRIPGIEEAPGAAAAVHNEAIEAAERQVAEAIEALDADESATRQAGETHRPVPFPRAMLASVIPIPPASEPAEQGPTRNGQIVTADVRFERLTELKGRKLGILQADVEETLGHYAEWAGVRTQRIRILNGLTFGSVLHLHQKIRIPLQRTDAGTFEQNRYEYHKRLQEDFFAVYHIGGLRPYTVRSGDNYWGICRDKFRIPLWLLKHSNPEVDLADLRVGRKLMIPIVEKASSADADPGVEEGADALTPQDPADGDPETGKATRTQPDAGA